jgi:hypothetical protein
MLSSSLPLQVSLHRIVTGSPVELLYQQELGSFQGLESGANTSQG